MEATFYFLLAGLRLLTVLIVKTETKYQFFDQSKSLLVRVAASCQLPNPSLFFFLCVNYGKHYEEETTPS